VRIRLDLSYDGTDFRGWAIQPALRTVQGSLEDALAMALRVPSVRVVCAGRTDTGVHARGQVVHFDVAPADIAASAGRSKEPALDALVRRLNGILPGDVRVRRAVEAAPGFDARFSAVWRRYAYRIADRPDVVDPLTRHHVLTWENRLDVDAMNAAAGHLIGLKDFAAFCKRREGATTVRTLLEFAWTRTPSGLIEGRVVADAFCHTMVRSLVGCLVVVGEGRQSPEWAAEMLAGRSRDPSMTVVHPRGLTLEEVGYPDADELAAQAVRTRARRAPE
jgi:tRNA pseudouridine38-40 synthase